MTKSTDKERFRKGLARLFSGYRAEWLHEEVFDLFTEPSYFPQLTTTTPSVLFGGRGTGKTTVLRCLSYEGKAALESGGSNTPDTWSYFGLYYRVNTSRVRAFRGSEVDEETWVRLFGHYINLELSSSVFRFLDWFSTHVPNGQTLDARALEPFGATFGMSEPVGQVEMGRRVDLERLHFESVVNSIADARTSLRLSLLGAPVDELLKAVRGLRQFNGKTFFFLVDEYENFDDYQQKVFNTLIKHCGELYSFKVGVKEQGFRQRSTLNSNEQLMHPADYKRIDISEELEGRFSEFAAKVCNRRLKKALQAPADFPDAQSLFPELGVEDEARLLGVETQAQPLRQEVEATPGLDGRNQGVGSRALRP